MIQFIAVFVGGGLGSLARYLFYLYLSKPTDIFPWPTFMANLFSSLILGVILASMAQADKSNLWYLLLATGFCGGFSTFSTFSAENFQLFLSGSPGMALLNIFANVVVCLLAIWIGFRGAQLF